MVVICLQKQIFYLINESSKNDEIRENVLKIEVHQILMNFLYGIETPEINSNLQKEFQYSSQ